MTKTTDHTAATSTPFATTTTDWMRLARGAAATMVVWAILLHLTARVIIPPVFVIGLVFVGFVPFLQGERRRLGLALAVFTALALAGNLPGIIDELTHLDSAPAFVLTLLSVIGAVAAIVAGLGAFFGWETGSLRLIVVGAVALFVVPTAASIVASATTDSDAARDGDVEIIVQKVEFTPAAITLTTDGAGIWIDNKDGIRHTFTIDGAGVDVEVPALKARRADLDLAPGTYEFVCTVPGHEAMTGTLVVAG